MITSRDIVVVISLLLLSSGLLLPTISIGHIPGVYPLKWWNARTWESVPATVSWAKLREQENDGRTTFRTEARYSYQWGNQIYRGRNVSFSAGSDNVGSFQQDTYGLLKQHLKNNTSATVWVNPRKPGESVMFRNIRINWLARTIFIPLMLVIVVATILVFLFRYVFIRIKN